MIAINEPAIRQWVLRMPPVAAAAAIRDAAKRAGRSPERALKVAAQAYGGDPQQRLNYYRGCGAVTLRILEAAMVPVEPPAFRPTLEECVYWLTVAKTVTGNAYLGGLAASGIYRILRLEGRGLIETTAMVSEAARSQMKHWREGEDELHLRGFMQAMTIRWLCRQAWPLVHAELVRRGVPNG